MNNRKDIELRSEKIRNIVGRIPPLLLSIGITVISLVIVIVLFLAYLIPYPQYYNVKIEIVTIPQYQLIRSPVSGVFYNNKKEDTDIGIIVTTDSIYNIKLEKKGKIVSFYSDSIYIYQNEIISIIMPDTIQSVFGICQIPSSDIEKFEENQVVNVTLSSGKIQKAHISKIDHVLQKNITNGAGYYKVIIQFEFQLDSSNEFNQVTGQILLSEKSLINLIFNN